MTTCLFANLHGTSNSYLEMLLKVAVLKNFENDTVKHLCWSLFFNRIAGLRYEILLK